MPTFAFKGRNRLNELVTGEREAATQDELRALLRREQIVMTQASEKGREISIPKLGRRKKVKSKELAVFTRQFSVMIDAGLPLVQCLDILGEQQQNAFFKDVLRQVRQNVEEGSTLFAALQKHPKVFDSLYTHMVEAGETGGVLDLILQRLATLIEKVVKLKRSIVSASIYPAAVILVAIGAIAIIMVVVIPQFQQIFAGHGERVTQLTVAAQSGGIVIRDDFLPLEIENANHRVERRADTSGQHFKRNRLPGLGRKLEELLRQSADIAIDAGRQRQRLSRGEGGIVALGHGRNIIDDDKLQRRHAMIGECPQSVNPRCGFGRNHELKCAGGGIGPVAFDAGSQRDRGGKVRPQRLHVIQTGSIQHHVRRSIGRNGTGNSGGDGGFLSENRGGCGGETNRSVPEPDNAAHGELRITGEKIGRLNRKAGLASKRRGVVSGPARHLS